VVPAAAVIVAPAGLGYLARPVRRQGSANYWKHLGPVSKLDSLRVLEEAGISAPSYRTVLRRLPVHAKESWRRKIPAACAAHTEPGRASVVLYDVSTLYFETDAGGGTTLAVGAKQAPVRPGVDAPRRLTTGCGHYWAWTIMSWFLS
jgi:hypothetical protein